MEPIEYRIEIQYAPLDAIISTFAFESRVNLYFKDNVLLSLDYDPLSGKHDEFYSFNFAFFYTYTFAACHVFVVNTRMDLDLIKIATQRFIAGVKGPNVAGQKARVVIFKKVYSSS